MATVAMMYLFLLEPFLSVTLSGKAHTAYKKASIITGKAMKTPPKIDRLTKFFLFTPHSRLTGSGFDLLEPESFAYFDPNLETKVIIHGFLDKFQIANWMHDMKDEFLRYGDYNVIIVDWSKGNTIPYTKAASNTNKVGKEVAELIAYLRDYHGARTEHFHVIGHSLGSHVSGFVGERIKPLGRITGLDPAMYHFTTVAPKFRLDNTDAIFVDVIHTDAGGIGIIEPIGHLDFYANGGSLQQGCTATNYLKSLLERGVVESFRNLICSHMRAILLFTDSINAKRCHMTALKCDSYQGFQSGTCGDCGIHGENCARMGFHAKPTYTHMNKSMYVATAGFPPYCVHQYYVSLFEAESDSGVSGRLLSPRGIMGKRAFTLTLLGSRRKEDYEFIYSSDKKEQKYMVISVAALGAVDSAIIRWSSKSVEKAVSAVVSRKIFPVINKIEIIPIELTKRGYRKFVLCSNLDSKEDAVVYRIAYCN